MSAAILAGLLATAFIVWAAACVILYKIQARLLYPGDGLPFGPFEALLKLGGEVQERELEGQHLRYYKVPAQGGAPKAWILLFHGNRFGARERFDFAERFTGWGYSVVLAELPGYAGDPRRASQRSLLRNGLAMADETLNLARGLPVFHFGESLGSAIATYTAVRRLPKGLLLSTPFTSLASIAQQRYRMFPILRLIKDPMPADRWAPHVNCPVLIVHGTMDKVVPPSQGRAQAKNFCVAPTFVSIEGPGHSEIRDAFPDQYWGGIRSFLARCMAAA